MSNPIESFSITADDIKFVGEALQRPECILAFANEDLLIADARGGIVHLSPTQQKVITPTIVSRTLVKLSIKHLLAF